MSHADLYCQPLSHDDPNFWYNPSMVGEDAKTGKYDKYAFPPFAVTVDMVVLTIVAGALQLLVVQRGGPPFKGRLALPGGFVKEDEELDAAANRELAEETNVRGDRFLRQIGVFGRPKRDPRMRVVSVAYLAILREVGAIRAATDAAAARLIPVTDVLGDEPGIKLAFDHNLIVTDGVEAARERLESTPIALSFVERVFTLSDLRAVYEAVWGTELDAANFRRKVLATPGFVTATGGRGKPGVAGGKPPDLYRSGRTLRLDPPLRRS